MQINVIRVNLLRVNQAMPQLVSEDPFSSICCICSGLGERRDSGMSSNTEMDNKLNGKILDHAKPPGKL